LTGQIAMTLSGPEHDAFRRDGLALPAYAIGPSDLARLAAAAAAAMRAGCRRDPHCGAGDAAAVLRAGACAPGLLGLIAPLIGPDIVLWRCELVHLSDSAGDAVPWHVDGTDWPLRPLETLSVRIALDRVDRASGCMRLLPRPHERLVREIRAARDRRALALAPDLVDPAIVVAAVRDPGGITLHDVDTFYCEPANRAGHRRAAIVYRFMAAHVRFEGARPAGADPILSVYGRSPAG
jgi:hypothetical protein